MSHGPLEDHNTHNLMLFTDKAIEYAGVFFSMDQMGGKLQKVTVVMGYGLWKGGDMDKDHAWKVDDDQKKSYGTTGLEHDIS